MINKLCRYILLILIVLSTFITIDVKAKEINFSNNITWKSFAEADIPNCNTLLGDVNNENSTAWLVQKILNYFKILGPTIAIVMGSLDISKAIISSDDESMKKAQSKFIKRIFAAVLLFFVPLLTQILLGLFGITSDNATCGLS